MWNQGSQLKIDFFRIYGSRFLNGQARSRKNNCNKGMLFYYLALRLIEISAQNLVKCHQ